MTLFASSQPKPEANRAIRRRPKLPGSRAIVGGVLVGLSAIGTFFVANGLHENNKMPVVVATHDLRVGHVLQSNDLRLVTNSAQSTASVHGFRSIGPLIGTTLLGPISDGELIQRGSVAQKRSAANDVEVSFSVPSSRALDGSLLSGETVDVLASNKTAANPQAVRAISGARVLRSQSAGSGMGKTGEVVVTLGLASREDATVLATAIDSGQITLVRTTGVAS